jgi:hypothetical protein
MRFCENCGQQLEDGEAFCKNCGTRCNDNVEENAMTNVVKAVKKKKRGKVIIALLLVLLVAGSLVGYFVAYPKYTQYVQAKENQKEAQKVFNLIDSLKEKEITVDSEEDLDKIKFAYNSLSNEQKKLIGNYKELENAYSEIESAKMKRIAEDVIAEINKIDTNSLTDADTSVQKLRERYNSLTDKQKELVTNSAKINDYEKIIENKKEEKERMEAENEQVEAEKKAQEEKINAGRELLNNFPGYSGTWNDFGAHVDKYQGMIESAIKSQINTSDYFDDPMILSFEATSFQRSQDLSTGACFVTFEGPGPQQGNAARVLTGTVSVDEVGNIEYHQAAYQ